MAKRKPSPLLKSKPKPQGKSSKQKRKFKTVKTGPVTGPEPDWLHDVPLDNLVNAITALAGEVYVLRERQRAMERELNRRNVMPADAVETHRPTPDEQQADQNDLKAFVTRLWSEIARTREPWAKVDPGVVKYLKQPK